MILSKHEMSLLVENIISKNGCPDSIEINTKNIQKSKVMKGLILRYENEILICYKNGEKFAVNEVFYYEHCKMIINEIEALIETLKDEENIKKL